MATIQDYENASLTAKRDVATTQFNLRRAYDAALETTKLDPADFYVAPDRLEDDAVRATFKDTLMNTLSAPYAAGLAAMPNDPQIAQQLLLSGWFGFGRSEIDNVIDGYKENLNFDNFSEFLNEKTQFKRSLGRRFDYTRSVLDDVSTADVVGHVGINPTQPDRIGLEDKIELMNLYEQHGVVSPNALRDKPYM
jgi:hypothetical protein